VAAGPSGVGSAGNAAGLEACVADGPPVSAGAIDGSEGAGRGRFGFGDLVAGVRPIRKERWTSSLARRSSARLRPSEREISRTSSGGSGSEAVGVASATDGPGSPVVVAGSALGSAA
jgi:hypothetical protein